MIFFLVYVFYSFSLGYVESFISFMYELNRCVPSVNVPFSIMGSRDAHQNDNIDFEHRDDIQ